MYGENTAGPEKFLESILKQHSDRNKSDSHPGKAIAYFSLFLTNYKSMIKYIQIYIHI